MRKAFSLRPVVELRLRVFDFSRDEANGGLPRLRTGQFGAKELAGFGTAKPFKERKSLVDQGSYPIARGSDLIHCHKTILSEKSRASGLPNATHGIARDPSRLLE